MITRLFTIVVLTCFFTNVCLAGRHSVVRSEGFVPNAATAIKIAEAVWEPIYGVGDRKAHQPTTAHLEEDTWIVQGSLPAGARGGVAIAEIRKTDGCILRISHGK